jgi:hypothetical protein
VWAVLVELDRYPAWNPFTIAATSTLREGDAIDLTVRMGGLGRTIRQREHVREVCEGERLRWGMKLGARWLLSGERDQRIESLGADGSRYTTEDAITGALAPLVWLIFGPSLEDGFASMTRALKREVERRATEDRLARRS